MIKLSISFNEKLESLPTERIKKEIKNGGNNVCK